MVNVTSKPSYITKPGLWEKMAAVRNEDGTMSIDHVTEFLNEQDIWILDQRVQDFPWRTELSEFLNSYNVYEWLNKAGIRDYVVYDIDQIGLRVNRYNFIFFKRREDLICFQLTLNLNSEALARQSRRFYP
jgi:hypothetical protein